MVGVGSLAQVSRSRVKVSAHRRARPATPGRRGSLARDGWPAPPVRSPGPWVTPRAKCAHAFDRRTTGLRPVIAWSRFASSSGRCRPGSPRRDVRVGGSSGLEGKLRSNPVGRIRSVPSASRGRAKVSLRSVPATSDRSAGRPGPMKNVRTPCLLVAPLHIVQQEQNLIRAKRPSVPERVPRRTGAVPGGPPLPSAGTR